MNPNGHEFTVRVSSTTNPNGLLVDMCGGFLVSFDKVRHATDSEVENFKASERFISEGIAKGERMMAALKEPQYV